MKPFTDNQNIIAIFVIIAASLVNAGSTLYLPAMLNIQHDFQTSNSVMRLTLSAYLMAFALSQFLHGPLSDAYGRRINLIMGCAVFIIGGFISLYSNTINAFITGRIVEGFGIGTANASGYALMRDLFKGNALASRLSHINISVSLTAIIAPVIGGYLTQYLGWRACFGLLILLSTSLVATKYFCLPETNKALDKTAYHPKKLISNSRLLFRNPVFICYCLISALTYSSMMLANSMLPFLLRHLSHHYQPSDYGWIITVIGLGFLVGSLASAYIVKKHSIFHTTTLGTTLMLATLVIANVLCIYDHSLWSLMVPLGLSLVGAGIVSPIAFGGALTPFPQIAGQAAAAAGALMFAIASICTAIGAHLNDTNRIAMFAMLLMMAIITMVIVQVLRLHPRMRQRD